jgi:hypothetical protein
MTLSVGKMLGSAESRRRLAPLPRTTSAIGAWAALRGGLIDLELVFSFFEGAAIDAEDFVVSLVSAVSTARNNCFSTAHLMMRSPACGR